MTHSMNVFRSSEEFTWTSPADTPGSVDFRWVGSIQTWFNLFTILLSYISWTFRDTDTLGKEFVL